MTNVEERIAELESRLAFQDDTLQALNDELVRQQRDIERLQLLVNALSQRQEELQTQIGTEADDEVPPPLLKPYRLARAGAPGEPFSDLRPGGAPRPGKRRR